jgi:hypothetical protein
MFGMGEYRGDLLLSKTDAQQQDENHSVKGLTILGEEAGSEQCQEYDEGWLKIQAAGSRHH